MKKRSTLFRLAALAGLLNMVCAPATSAQSLPNFSDVAATQLVNTNGEWVRFDPAQPNNIDLVETRIFKMPQKGSGVLGIQFKLAGADGGTARFQWGANNKFSKGGGGAVLTFDFGLLEYYYGDPFFVTFGKKGESKTIHEGLYYSGGGGGSTGMGFLRPGATPQTLSINAFIAGAGGGGGGFSYIFGTLDGNSATRTATLTTPGVSHYDIENYKRFRHQNIQEEDVVWTISGGSSLQQNNDPLPVYCCTNELKQRAATSLPYTEFDYAMTYGLPGGGTSTLQSVTHGQKGGRPTAIFMSANNTSNTTGLGIAGNYYLLHSGGRGGAGFGGGGAGSSTTTMTNFRPHAENLPTGGAGGTAAYYHSSYAAQYPDNGEGGWNYYLNIMVQNLVATHRPATDNPQSGYMMYRTIPDTVPPQINISNITVSLKDGTTYFNYRPEVTFAEAIEPYLMKTNGLWDNDGIASVTASVYGEPLTRFECYMAGSAIPADITVTDGAGNTTTALVMINVVDPFKPIQMLGLVSNQINVSDGPVTLTAANFLKAYDGCKGTNVTTRFPATTFYCNDAGQHTIEYYYTDTDGNSTEVYTKTFNVVCNGANEANQLILYVDETATGDNNGLSWENAFTNLQDALNYPSSSAYIYVAKGTYYPVNYVNRDATFTLRNNAKVYGGFPSGGADFEKRNPEANPTILSGKISSADNSYHVVTITGNNTRLEGFTIRDGKADKNATDGGGGLFLIQTETNLGTDHTTVIRNCKFIDNYGTYGGAAFFDYKNQANQNSLNIENCAFTDNATYYSGGAVFLRNPSSDNMHAKLINSVFNGNTANAGGGAVALDSYTSAEITNCTFSSNHAVSNGGALFSNGKVELHNSILYFNTSTNNPHLGEIYRNGGTIQVDYSNIRGSGGSGNWSFANVQDLGSNIDTDPMFSSSPVLSLLPASPCRNAGKNDYNTEIYDIYGSNYRIKQDVIDMGAFETDLVVYVAADASAGGDGTSWAAAFNNLNDGIAAAGTGALQKDVWVKQGIYRPDRPAWPANAPPSPGNRENTFRLHYTLKIYGGFAGTESSIAQRNIGANPTILSGDIGVPNDASDNVYHVVYMQSVNSVLDGLIIEGGNANGIDENSRGGGVFNDPMYGDNSNKLVANCVFRNNHAADKGGAWYSRAIMLGGTDFVQSVFYNNTAGRGAAVYIGEHSHFAGPIEFNYYNVTATNNTSSESGAGAFEAAQFPSYPLKHTFYNSLLVGNTPQNYNDVTNPGLITLTNTYTSESATNIFANPSNPAGADGKIMTADDGLQLNVLSPAISYGSADWLYSSNLDKDITGRARILSIIDAGAYESPYNAPLVADGQGIIYVRTVPFGEGTGSSWENATSDLHNAIHASHVQKVFVAIGTYKVGAHSFIMKNGVEIYGGFDPENNIRDLSHKRIMPDPSSIYGVYEGSILDGQLVRPVIWNIFTAGTEMNSTAVLDGFLLRSGKHPTGGGVRNIYASPTLRNIVMTSNQATIAGAGMYNENSSPSLTNVLINHNIIDTRINSNGGQPVSGGGIYNTANSNPVLTNVTIGENRLLTAGEAMHGAGIYNLNSSPVIKNSIFFNNAKSFNTTIAGADIQDEGSSATEIKNSITQSYDTGNPADGNKVGVNPNFVNFGGRNFRLTPGSPAIDAGDNALFTGLNADSKDIDGNPRIFDAENGKKIDMGAYEYQCLPVDYSIATMEDITLDYDGNVHSITAGNLVEGVVATYEITDSNDNNSAGNTATNAGTYIITATITPLVSGEDCEPVIKTGVLTINKAATVITADQVQSYVYDGAVKEVTASLNHTESVLDYVPQQGYTDAGVYPVTIFVPETANYLAASETVNLAIENADFTDITLEDASFVYDGSPKSLEIAGALPSGAEALYAGNEKTDIGTYSVGALIQLPNYNDLWLTATLTITDPLPVELVSFNVHKQEKTALLEWMTVAEYQNAGFEIERSRDGTNWAVIGFVPSHSVDGNSTSQSAYRFTDETPGGGTHYYRLKQLDQDGGYEYSPIRSVSLYVVSEMKAWPIPVTDYVTIEFGSSYLGSRVTLVNGLGTVLQELEVKEARLKFNMQKYPSGIYLIRAFDGKTLKLVK